MGYLKKIQVLVRQMLLASVTFGLSACGGGTSTPPPKTLLSIQVTSQSQSLAVGSSVQLTAAGSVATTTSPGALYITTTIR